MVDFNAEDKGPEQVQVTAEMQNKIITDLQMQNIKLINEKEILENELKFQLELHSKSNKTVESVEITIPDDSHSLFTDLTQLFRHGMDSRQQQTAIEMTKQLLNRYSIVKVMSETNQ